MIGRYGPPVFQIFRGLSGSYNVALMKALPKTAEISKDFIFYLLQEPRLTEYVVANSERTAGQSGVNLSLLEQYPAFAPPLQLQNQFSAAVGRVSELTRRANRQSALSEALFAALQHRAFQGTL
jgi:type I restriction enzyme S subunit